jgi:tetratricopeptide (TPR) repeat protein
LKNFYITALALILLFSCRKVVKTKETQNNVYYDKAFDYRKAGRPDSAFQYFYKAKDLFSQRKDSLGVAKCLVNMGIILTDKCDYFGGQELSLAALKYFNESDTAQYKYIHSNYNNLGIATYKLEDFKNALKFYDAAIRFSKDSLDIRLYLDNKGKCYQQIKQYHSALKIYNQILNATHKNAKEYARALTNITYTHWLKNNDYPAAPLYHKALHLRSEVNDLLGQNSSYSHLSDYFIAKNTDSALYYATMMLKVATELNSPDDKRAALEKLIKLSPSSDSKKYFEIYQKQTDSLQSVRNAAKNQFALIRYDSDKNRVDLFRAKAINVLKENDILRKNIAVGLLIIVLILGYIWYRKRQRTLKQEKELEVKNTEIKYVKKIHDRVANKVYQVMSEVENTPLIDRDTVLDKLEGLYHITRDISYDVTDLDLNENYVDQLHKMIKSYESNKVGIITVGNEDDLWCDVSDAAKFEVYYIIQELLTNMRKHSHADSVVLKFYTENQQMKISYIDNGIGMQGANKKNGLSNTENRIKLIRGSIIFDSTQDQEFKVNLVFPLS